MAGKSKKRSLANEQSTSETSIDTDRLSKLEPAMAAREPEIKNSSERLSLPRPVMDAFYDLASANNDKKLVASSVILKFVEMNSVMDTKKPTKVPPAMQYIIKRIVSGMASDREHARQGFFITLQALLQFNPSLTEATFEMMQRVYVAAPTKAEQSANMVGELLVCGALIRAGRVKHTNKPLREHVVKRLFELKNAKTYSEVVAAQFIVNLIELSSDEDDLMVIMSHMKSSSEMAITELTPSALWIRFVLLRKLGEKAPLWLTTIGQVKNYKDIGHVLMQTAAEIPNIHPLIEEIGLTFSAGRELVRFWQVAIDPLLVNAASKVMQVAFYLAQLVLPHMATSTDVANVLGGGSLVYHLITAIPRSDSELQAAARGLAAAILQRIVAHKEDVDNKMQTAILRAVILHPGSVRFDALTGTRLLQQAGAHLSTATVKSLAGMLCKVIELNTEDDTGKSASAERVFAAHWLARLLSHLQVCKPEYATWRSEQSALLMKLAFFTPGEADQQGFRDAFIRSLDLPARHLTEYLGNLHHLVALADDCLKSEAVTGVVLSVEAKGVWKQVKKKLKHLKAEEDRNGGVVVFQILYAHMALQLLVDANGVAELVDELGECQRRALQKMRKREQRKLEVEEPNWVEVVVEVLISLLAKNSHFWRKVVQTVFRLLCPMLTPGNLVIITDVLNPEKQVEDELSDEESDEEEDADEEEDETEGEESAMEEDENQFELRKKMIMVCGGDLEDDVDMDDMTPEEMDRLNTQLGSLFKQYSSNDKKKDKKKLGEKDLAEMHFHSRVCDLLEVLIKDSPSISCILALVVPLLEALKSALKDKRFLPLQNRLRNLLKQLSKVKKFKSNGNLTGSDVALCLNTLLTTFSRLPDNIKGEVAGCCSLVVRCGCQLLGDEQHREGNPVVAVVKKHINALFVNRDCQLSARTFKGPLLLDCASLWSVTGQLVEHSFSANTRLFLRMHGLELLRDVFSNEALLRRVGKKAVLQLEASVGYQAAMVFDSMICSEDIKLKYTVNLVELLRTICLYHRDAKISGLPLDALAAAIASFRQRVSVHNITELKKSLGRLCQILGIANIIKGKVSNSDITMANLDSGREDTLRKSSSKKKKTKEEGVELPNEKTTTRKKRYKRSEEWYMQRKLQMGSTKIDELESFSFVSSLQLNDFEEASEQTIPDDYNAKNRKKLRHIETVTEEHENMKDQIEKKTNKKKNKLTRSQ